MGRVSQLCRPFAVELYGNLGRPYTGLEAEQFPSGFEAAASRLSVECGQESQLGAEKEAASICEAFVRHTPRFHQKLCLQSFFKCFDAM